MAPSDGHQTSRFGSLDPEGRGLLMFCLGALTSALVVASVYIAQSGLPSDEPELGQGSLVDARPSTGSEPGTDSVPTTDSEATTHFARCQEVYDAQSLPLDAAAGSLAQWEVHIGAMNKLVVGAITLKQAWQFWNQTRVGAALRLQRFADARRQFNQRTARCPAPSGLEEVTPELRTCSEAVAARRQTLGLATVALSTWRMHVHHMEMLRKGEMTPEEATQMWIQSWRQGDREVRAYRTAAREAAGMTCSPT